MDTQAEVNRRCGGGDISCRPIQEGTSLYISMAYCEGEERPELQAVMYFERLCQGLRHSSCPERMVLVANKRCG